MPITKRPGTPATPESDAAINAFIQGAPDSQAGQKQTEPSQSSEVAEQISIRVPKALLDRATKMAERQGIPRASYIKRALALQLEQDEK